LSTDGHLFGSDATSLVGCSGRLCLDYAAVDIIRNKCSTHFVSNLSVYLSCLLRHSSSSSVKRWFAAQRYYVHKSCVQERRKGTKVACSVMWTYNIYACDIGTYCDYFIDKITLGLFCDDVNRTNTSVELFGLPVSPGIKISISSKRGHSTFVQSAVVVRKPDKNHRQLK